MDLNTLNSEIVMCRKCPRLVAWREQVAREKRRAYRDWEYWGKPVPGFGDPKARVVVVGLAPGAHGSNRTGRPFTGDASGLFLYSALYRAGFANQPDATRRDDDLELKDLYITAVARCVPPANKPLPEELDHCQPFLEQELELLQPKVIVCLGRVAFERILRMLSLNRSGLTFAHGAAYRIEPDANENGKLPRPEWIVCSYHPSQQNTSTGKLTRPMFDRVWAKAHKLIQND